MQKLTFVPFDKMQPILSDAESNKIVDILNAKHSLYLKDEVFELTNGFNNDQFQIKFCLKKNDDSINYPIEIICIYDDYKHYSKIDLMNIIIDYVDIYWSEYFADDRNLFVPLDWSSYQCEDVQFFLRGCIRNLQLETQADNYLKEYGFGEHDISSISFET